MTTRRTTRKHPAPGTLTQRYVHAATRRLGDDQRDDVALELRAGIADRVDSMRSADPSLAESDAEHAALLELGDPDALSASYAGTRQHLIGPEHFATYVRTLKAITVVAVPATVITLAVIDSATGEGPLSVIGHAVWTGFSLVVHIAFWVTVAFALVERSDEATTASLGVDPWRPEDLPDVPSGPAGALGETVVTVAWLGLLAGFVVWQQAASPVRGDGERVPFLDPDLWSFWIPLILVSLLAEALFEVVKYRAGGVWTPRFATVNTVTGLVFAAPVAWLAWQQELLNPALSAHVREGWPEFDPAVAHTVILVAAVAIWVWDTVDGWRRTAILGS